MEYYVYWLLKSPCLEVSGDGKYGLFLSQKVNRKMIFADYWKILVLNFSEIGNTVFFEPKSWWEDDIYWLPKSSCFELFAEGEYGLLLSQKVDEKMIFTDYWKVLILNFSEMWNTVFFLSQNVDGKMIFTLSFWAFHDIPGLAKYGFSCNVIL